MRLCKQALTIIVILLGAAVGVYESDRTQTAFAQQNQGHDLNFRADVKGATVTFYWNDITLSGAAVTNYHLATDDASYQFSAAGRTSYTALLGTHPFLTPGGSMFAPGDTVTYKIKAYDYDRRASTGGGLLVAADTVTITLPTNSPPVADAGRNQTVISRAEGITLGGSASTDPDNDGLMYRWKSLDGLSLSDMRAVKPSVGIPTVHAGSSTFGFNLTVSDGLASRTDTTYITVKNSAPVADAGKDVLVTVNGTVRLDAFRSSDHDGSGLTYLWEQTAGTPVSFTNDTKRVGFAAPASPTLITFHLTVSDGELTGTDTVLVRAVTTRQPVADTGASKHYAVFGQRTALNGTESSDPDGDRLGYHWEQVSGSAVSISNSRNAVAYFTAPDVAGTAVFRLTVSDSVFSISDLLRVIIDKNRPPDASISGAVTHPEGTTQPATRVRADHYVPSGGVTFTLDGSESSDPDGDRLAYSWIQTGGPPVSLSGARADMASFSTHSLRDHAAILAFSLTVRDVAGNTDTAGVTVYVDGISRPTADAGSDIEASPGDIIQFNGTGSFSPIGSDLTYSWTQTGGTGAMLSNALVASPTVTAPDADGTETLVYALTVRDVDDQSDTDTVSVVVSEKARPVANAGPNQNVGSGSLVTLNAGDSTAQAGGNFTYFWTQSTGTRVALSDPDVAAPTFTAPVTGYDVLTFTLLFGDGTGHSDRDTVVITVGSNTPPVADAGSDIDTTSGSTVRLSGSATDQDGDQLTYSWTQTSGTDVTMRNTQTARPTFIAPNTDGVEMLTFKLTVTDDFGNIGTDAVAVTVNPQSTVITPSPPAVADAGVNQRVDAGSTVNLDGSGSSGSDLTYSWTQASGPSITLSDSAIASPSFTAPDSTATIVLSLAVTSGDATDDDAVGIAVVGSNSPPVASAGSNQEVSPGSSVRLSGSASDPDDDALTYSWTQASGTTVSLSGSNGELATFTAPSTTGTLVFKLTVSDALGHTVSDTTRVTVTSSRPVADAGTNLNARPGETVTLDGSGSRDPDGDSLTYSWTQVGGTDVSLSGSSGTSPSFTAPPVAEDTLTFEVVVSDGNGNMDADTVDVHVYSTVTVADAGDDMTVTIGDPASLDGSGSSVGFGSINYAWTQVSGTSVALGGSDGPHPTFTAPGESSTLVFRLTVTNGVSEDTDTVTVTADSSDIPVMSLGPDRSVASGAAVELSTNAMDDDDLWYGWKVLSGFITLSSYDSPGVIFTAPTVYEGTRTIVVAASVSDGRYFIEDEITITVIGNAKPIVDAGDQHVVLAGSRATLDGSGTSDPDGDYLTYSWEQAAGEPVTIHNANSATAYFTAPSPAPPISTTSGLIFQLTVSDGVNTVRGATIIGVVDSFD